VAAAPAYLDPTEQALIEDSRDRRASASTARDRVWWARWTAAMGFAAVAVLVAAAAPGPRHTSFALALLLVASYAVAARVEFEVGSGVVVPTELVFAAMMFTLPARILPSAVGLAMAASHLPEVLRARERVVSVLPALGSCWFALGPTAVLLALHEPAAASSRWPLLFALVLVQTVTDFVTTALREWWALGVRPRELVSALVLIVSVDTVLAPIGFLAAMSGSAASLAAPLLLLWLLNRHAQERRAAIDGAVELGRAYRGTAYLLGDVVEADDAYTGAHSRDVVDLSLAVADRLALPHSDKQRIELVALLHDVGKIRIPPEISRKPGPLTADERAVIETHTIIGEELLHKVGGLLAEVGTIVRSCHEKWDGSGYPDGLAGEEIPLIARIICCADAFNAMTTTRSYRPARSFEDALAEVRRCAGTHFDPAVAAALVEVAERERH
jgi:HD-GYP domain-containing protein (c-di-GMP phosphodiesterase class II)